MSVSVTEICERAAAVRTEVAALSTSVKDAALHAMADALESRAGYLTDENKLDLETAKAEGSAPSVVDRLTLTESRIASMAEGLRDVASQSDPVGEIVAGWRRPNGILIEQVRVPLGVVAVIYEARPNVTADVAGLCLKSGNACVLRGSSIALASNKAIASVLREAVSSVGAPVDAIQLVPDAERASATELMQAKGLVDLLVPRGGKSLIASIEADATVPYIIDGDGNCHVYIDASADEQMATDVIVNAKTSRPGVCNAAETLLVHSELAEKWLPGALAELTSKDVEIRADERVLQIWPEAVPASEEDWETEFLGLILAVKIVDSLDEAIAHISRYGTSNAEAIVTSDISAARRFVRDVDSGSVFVNCSTRFSDGGEFGYGAEIGISTQKLHARGPMGLTQLTSTKYTVWGEGQIRS